MLIFKSPPRRICSHRYEEECQAFNPNLVFQTPCLVWCMLWCVQGLTFHIWNCEKVMHNLGKEHWLSVKWIPKYILKTLGMSRKKYILINGQLIVEYCNPNYASDLDKHWSTIGYVFYSCKSTNWLGIYLTIHSCILYKRGRISGYS